MDTKDSSLRDRVQKQVVELITAGLEGGTISEDRARGIAKMILEKLPEGLDDKQMIEIIPQLDDEYTELAEVVIPIVLEHERKIKKAIEDKVIKLIRSKKYGDAIDVAKKGIEYSRKLGE